jgi:hypothetical protein
VQIAAMLSLPPSVLKYAVILTWIFPLVAVALMAMRRVWVSAAPALLAVLPIAANTLVAYLALRDGLLPEALGLLLIGAFFSAISAGIGLLIARRRARTDEADDGQLRGRRLLLILAAATAVLLAALFAAALVGMSAGADFWPKLQPPILIGAALTALVVLAIVIGIIVLVIRAKRDAAIGWDRQVIVMRYTTIAAAVVAVIAFLVEAKTHG